jgi:lipoprotein-anchoring transpeptidase ErfK/SrfK
MLKTLLFSFLLLFQLPALTMIEIGRSKTASHPELESGSVVCPPALSKGVPSDCLPLGPSEYVTQSIAEGIPFPLIPLPAYAPDRSLVDSPYQYFKVIDTGASLYSSLDAARAHTSTKILYPSNDLYVSYLSNAVRAGKDYYYPLRSGYWVFADGGRLGQYDPPFQGLQFSSTPRNAFGWILGEVQSRLAPGVNAPPTGITRYRFQVVQIYAAQKVDNLDWVLVGPGEWIDSRQVARVDPSRLAPEGVTGGRWIAVNLFEQTLTVYNHNQLVFATMAATGVDHFWTRPGLFHIQRKLETETMSNSVPDDFYYLEDVPWTMYFDEGRALHGAYWHNGFGYPHSHGCVNLSVGDAHWLYNWASEGDFVYVYDPSGQTPTDPSLFGAGAP